MTINTKLINEDGSVALLDGYVSTWNSTLQKYEGLPPPPGGLPTGPAGGDLGSSYPNPEVNDLTIASEEQGSVLYFNGINWVQLSPGNDGYVFTTHNTSSNPTWEAPSSTIPSGAAGGDLGGTFPNPEVNDLTITSEEQGSILYFNGTNWVQLSPGTAGRFLRTDGTGTDPVWATNVPDGSAGGDLGGTYPNPEVNDLTIAGEEQGSSLYYDGSNWVTLSPGADGYVLSSNGLSNNLTWITPAKTSVVWRPGYVGSESNVYTDLVEVFTIAKSMETFVEVVFDLTDQLSVTLPDVVMDGNDKVLIRIFSSVTAASTITWDTNTEIRGVFGIVGKNDVGDGTVTLTAASSGPNNCFFYISRQSPSFSINGNITCTTTNRYLVQFADNSAGRFDIYQGVTPFSKTVEAGGDLDFYFHPGSEGASNMVEDLGDHGGALTAHYYGTGNLPSAASIGPLWTGTRINEYEIASYGIIDNPSSIYYPEGVPSGLISTTLTTLAQRGVYGEITLIYRPGSTANGNIYTDLSSLNTAIAAIRERDGRMNVILDGEFSSNIIIINENLECNNLVSFYVINADKITFDEATILNCSAFICDRMVLAEPIGSGLTRSFQFTSNYSSTQPPILKNMRYHAANVTLTSFITISSGVGLNEIVLDNVFAPNRTDCFLIYCSGTSDTTLTVNMYGDGTLDNIYLIADGFDGFLTVNYYGDTQPVSSMYYWNNAGSTQVINNLGATGAPRSEMDTVIDPLGLWSFNKNGLDRSGNSKDLTFNSAASYAPGPFRGSSSFDLVAAANNATSNDASFQITGSLVIEMVILVTAATPTGTLLSCSSPTTGSSADNYQYRLLYGTGGGLNFSQQYGAQLTEWYGGPTAGAIPFDEWVHIAIVRSASGLNVSYYINGNMVASNTVVNVATDGANSQLNIGGLLTFSSDFRGKISEVRVDDASYTSADIRRTFENVIGFVSKEEAFTTLTYKPGYIGKSLENHYTDLISLQARINNITNLGAMGEIVFDASDNLGVIPINSQILCNGRFSIKVLSNVDKVEFSDTIYSCERIECVTMTNFEQTGTSALRCLYHNGDYGKHVYLSNIWFSANSTSPRPLLTSADSTSINEFTYNNVRGDYYVLEVIALVGNYCTANFYGDDTLGNRLVINDVTITNKHLEVNYYGNTEPSQTVNWANSGNTYTINNLGATGGPRGELDLNNSPIGIWNFRDNGFDESTSNRDLMWIGSGVPEFAPGPFSGARSIDCDDAGDGYYSIVNSNFEITGAMTFEAVIFIHTAATSNEFIASVVGDGATSDDNTLWGVLLDSNNRLRILQEFSTGTQSFSDDPGISVPVGEWVHIAFTRDSSGTSITTFINGIPQTTSTMTAPTGGTDGMVRVGCWKSGGSAFSGKISGIKIDTSNYTDEDLYLSAFNVIGDRGFKSVREIIYPTSTPPAAPSNSNVAGAGTAATFTAVTNTAYPYYLFSDSSDVSIALPCTPPKDCFGLRINIHGTRSGTDGKLIIEMCARQTETVWSSAKQVEIFDHASGSVSIQTLDFFNVDDLGLTKGVTGEIDISRVGTHGSDTSGNLFVHAFELIWV